MLFIDDIGVKSSTPFSALVAAIRKMFQDDCHMPVRHHHTIGVPGEPDATLLLMPAWTEGHYLGVKIASVFPGNQARSLPSVSGSYLLSSALTGENLALIDGGELTARRTAAASALASSYLSRPDSRALLVCGTGRLSANLVEAHASQRPIEKVMIWGRDLRKAEAAAAMVSGFAGEIVAVTDLEAAAGMADIISCATLSTEPLIKGAWLTPGTHLDLVGAFTPKMRECDDEAVQTASLFADTRGGALAEGGDLVQPIAKGLISEADIKGDLYDLCRGIHQGRHDAQEITLFKSVGAALEDLAGAILAFETRTKTPQSDG